MTETLMIDESRTSWNAAHPAGADTGERPLRLGTRPSTLAVTQSRWVARQLSEVVGRSVELVAITTPGDAALGPIDRIGSSGVFVSSVREALQQKRVDLVVHSLKDLPTETPNDLVVAAIPAREDPRDALVSRGSHRLFDLPSGSRIGTSSLRRVAELRRLALPVEVQPLRGNIDSRLRMLLEGRVDALIIAAAGLARLGRSDVVTELLDPAVMLPAPAQGALAVECRADDDAMLSALDRLDHLPTRIAITAERGFLAALGLGCSAAVAALATLTPQPGGDIIHLEAMAVLNRDGTPRRWVGQAPARDAAALGRRLAMQAMAAERSPIGAGHD